ncbi:MAG: glycosyl hydrolase family 18 protein [Patescibacteria group bacterium]
MRSTIAVILFLSANVPGTTHAAEVAAWVPWFAEESGAKSALKHIDELDILYPFVYEVSTDADIVNKVDLRDRHWRRLLNEARDEDVKVIPTISWFDGDAIHEVLHDDEKRDDHIRDIVRLVKNNDFDGINIDYESRLAETIDDYSLFLEELADALPRKTVLTCTVEARTPPESLWRDVPKRIEYSNDYRAINRHCDWIEIMAYDQQRADLKLNDERKGVPYMPVADVEWVEKVLDLALEDFDNDKVMLGVPTYGRAWDITVAKEWYRDYTPVATLNHEDVLNIVQKYGVPIGRTAGGEAVVSYFPEDSVWKIFNQLPTPTGTPLGYEAAAKALLVATVAEIELPVRFVTWSDAAAIADKVELVDKYNLRGTAIFKIDGEEDEELWDLF